MTAWLALNLFLCGMWIGAFLGRYTAERRAASAIEARRAETAETGSVHESAVGEAETPDNGITSEGTAP